MNFSRSDRKSDGFGSFLEKPQSRRQLVRRLSGGAIAAGVASLIPGFARAQEDTDGGDRELFVHEDSNVVHVCVHRVNGIMRYSPDGTCSRFEFRIDLVRAVEDEGPTGPTGPTGVTGTAGSLGFFRGTGPVGT